MFTYALNSCTLSICVEIQKWDISKQNKTLLVSDFTLKDEKIGGKHNIAVFDLYLYDGQMVKPD